MLFLTTKDADHHHVVFVRDDGTGVTSVNEDHSHLILGGELEEVNGHRHLIREPDLNKKSGESKDDVKVDILRLYDEMKSYESDSRERAKESYDFYNGRQWRDEDKQAAIRRPLLTLNEIRSKINILRGYHLNNRTDIVYRPVESMDSLAAEVYTRAIKSILERTDYFTHESRVLLDALVTGRGVFHVYMDYDDDIEGEIKVRYLAWDEVFYAPHSNLDLSDCDASIHTRWMTLTQAQQLFPEFADKIQESFDRAFELNDEPASVLPPDQRYHHGQSAVLFNKLRKSVRYIECWRQEYARAQVAVNVMEDEYVSLTGWDAKDIRAIHTIPGFELVPRTVARMRVTRMVGDVVISDEYPDLADACYHTFPVYCYKDGESFVGLVEDMKDAQRIENKMFSQYVDILNKIASNGWFYDQQTFADAKEEAKFKKLASTPGFVIKVRNTQHVPQMVTPPQIPTPIAQLVEQAAMKMREVSNINLDVQGLNSDAQSGVAIIEKKRQALIGNAFVFDNLAFTKRRLGRLLLRMLVKYYTPERVYKLLLGANAREAIQLTVEGKQVPLDAISPEAILNAISNPDPAKFDVVVDESPFNTTMRRANFLQWAQMAANGVQVPPALLIEMSDLPNKAQALQLIQQAAEQSAQTERLKYETEIQKALIAAQAKMNKTEAIPEMASPPGPEVAQDAVNIT